MRGPPRGLENLGRTRPAAALSETRYPSYAIGVALSEPTEVRRSGAGPRPTRTGPLPLDADSACSRAAAVVRALPGGVCAVEVRAGPGRRPAEGRAGGGASAISVRGLSWGWERLVSGPGPRPAVAGRGGACDPAAHGTKRRSGRLGSTQSDTGTHGPYRCHGCCYFCVVVNLVYYSCSHWR